MTIGCGPLCVGDEHRGVDCAYVRAALAVEYARLAAWQCPPSTATPRRCPWCGLRLPCGC